MLKDLETIFTWCDKQADKYLAVWDNSQDIAYYVDVTNRTFEPIQDWKNPQGVILNYISKNIYVFTYIQDDLNWEYLEDDVEGLNLEEKVRLYKAWCEYFDEELNLGLIGEWIDNV